MENRGKLQELLGRTQMNIASCRSLSSHVMSPHVASCSVRHAFLLCDTFLAPLSRGVTGCWTRTQHIATGCKCCALKIFKVFSFAFLFELSSVFTCMETWASWWGVFLRCSWRQGPRASCRLQKHRNSAWSTNK